MLARAEARRLEEADLLAGVTAQVVDRWPDRGSPRLVLPNGCDPAAYVDVANAAPPLDV